MLEVGFQHAILPSREATQTAPANRLINSSQIQNQTIIFTGKQFPHLSINNNFTKYLFVFLRYNWFTKHILLIYCVWAEKNLKSQKNTSLLLLSPEREMRGSKGWLNDNMAPCDLLLLYCCCSVGLFIDLLKKKQSNVKQQDCV